MIPQLTCDVAVVPSGPNWISGRISLQKYTGIHAMILEASESRTSSPGQTISPGALPLLDYLGVRELLDHAHHLPSYGTDASWGEPKIVRHESVFTALGNGWHLDRTKFDCGLAPSR